VASKAARAAVSYNAPDASSVELSNAASSGCTGVVSWGLVTVTVWPGQRSGGLVAGVVAPHGVTRQRTWPREAQGSGSPHVDIHISVA
jgi:hypothetical protein